jgi:uncharacterized iron-regulated protein
MRPALVAAALALVVAAPVRLAAQPVTPAADRAALDPSAFRVYTGDGRPATFEAVVSAMGGADAVFLGEQHDDATAHALERAFLEAAHGRYGATRPIVLGLEMIERDAQHVLDEYRFGYVRERDFLAASRPWGNYASDYRPLVEFSRERGLDIAATNVPGRYANLVARGGVEALDRLPLSAHAFLPASPPAPPSAALAARFREAMSGMEIAHGGASASPHAPNPHGASPHGAAAMPTVDGLLAAQNLRDAAMAEAVSRHLERQPGALVVHVNGAFHSEGGLGIPEHLVRYRPGTRTLVVTMRRTGSLGAAPEASPGDDFVILTGSP